MIGDGDKTSTITASPRQIGSSNFQESAKNSPRGRRHSTKDSEMLDTIDQESSIMANNLNIQV